MGAVVMIAGLFLAQAATTTVVADGAMDRVEVGYEELMQGRPDAAIARITASEANGPAAQINLGTAYARMGRTEVARGYFMAAIANKSRYDLQLSDGRWMDSRRAARTAVRYLETGKTLAVR